ncbi:MAG TPA: hypothetical protein VFE05_03185, partial [Longimicrobiaceae bacterium]|nr:hypothetical protein [Longimicrobiaceae bacterium]
LTVAPVAMCGALLAAGLDRFLPERNGVRTALAFAAWSAGIALWAAAGRDVFGLGYLAAATAGDGHVPALSVGVIASQGIPSVAWTFAPLEPAFIAGRLGFALLATAAAAGLGSLLRFQSVASPSSVPHLPSVRVEEERATPRPTLAIVAAQTGSLAGTSLIIAGRWMRRSRLAWMGMAGALIAALVPGTAPGVALAVALTVPMAVVSRTSAREVHVASALEATTAAFLRPSAALMHGWVLGVLTLAPALPAVARMGGVQAATACAGVLGSALWLTWTHRCAARPLLGISTLAALWYLNVFDAPPGPLDLLGLWHPSPSALVAATSFTAAMAWLLWRSDRRTAGARRMPA